MKKVVLIFISLLFTHPSIAGHPGMVHPPLDISTEKNTPSLNTMITKDSGTGWNIHIETRHFRFAPENVGKGHIPGQGHAHIYLDGQKLARVYGHWHHIKALQPGKHEIKITLNANTHSQLFFKSKPIEQVIEITEPVPTPINMNM